MTPSPYTQYKTLNANTYVVVVAVAFVFVAGTGGYSTAQCFGPRGSKGQSEERIASGESAKAVVARNEDLAAPSHAEDLKLVRDYFKPSVAQLAGALGVERQTIYDWQAGKGVSDERREVIRELASACSKLAEAGIAAGDDIFRRKISNGQTLLQLIATGTPAGEAVGLTKSILEIEKHERQLLAEHLKRRPLGTIDTTDAGKPHLNEEG
jgi:DNA-binding XRE family transcriptional regulator